MAVVRPVPTRQWYRIGIAVFVIVVGVGVAVTLAPTAGASAQVDTLSVDGTEHTVDDDIQDVLLDALVAYQYDVADAEQYIVELQVGESAEELETIAWDYDDEPEGAESGTVELEGSLLDADAFSAEDLQPPLAETEETDVVVGVVLEVERENGETETATETETVTLTVHDGGSVEVSVGGDVTITVEE